MLNLVGVLNTPFGYMDVPSSGHAAQNSAIQSERKASSSTLPWQARWLFTFHCQVPECI